MFENCDFGIDKGCQSRRQFPRSQCPITKSFSGVAELHAAVDWTKI